MTVPVNQHKTPTKEWKAYSFDAEWKSHDTGGGGGGGGGFVPARENPGKCPTNQSQREGCGGRKLGLVRAQ